MDVGGARVDRVDPSDCINPIVPLSLCDAESARPRPHHPHPTPRAGASRDAGLRGGGPRHQAAQDRWADRGPVLVGGVASHGAPLVGQIGPAGRRPGRPFEGLGTDTAPQTGTKRARAGVLSPRILRGGALSATPSAIPQFRGFPRTSTDTGTG